MEGWGRREERGDEQKCRGTVATAVPVRFDRWRGRQTVRTFSPWPYYDPGLEGLAPGEQLHQPSGPGLYYDPGLELPHDPGPVQNF